MTSPGAMEQTWLGVVNVPWLQGGDAPGYLGGMGAEQDRLIDRARSAVKMRWGTGPGMVALAQRLGVQLDTAIGDSARLKLIGAGFNLPKLGGMTDAQYEAYLEDAWNLYALGGTPASVLDAIGHIVGDGIGVFVDEEYLYHLGNGWNMHRFTVRIVVPPASFTYTPPYTFTALGGALGSLRLGVAQVDDMVLAAIKREIRKWKDAAALCLDIAWTLQDYGASVLLGQAVLGGCSLGQACDVVYYMGRGSELGRVVLGQYRMNRHYM